MTTLLLFLGTILVLVGVHEEGTSWRRSSRGSTSRSSRSGSARGLR